MDNSFVSEQQVNDASNKILSMLEAATAALQQIKEENRALEETRSLSIIHLAQYRSDYEGLQAMYRKFKDCLQRDNIPRFVPQQPAPIPRPAQQPMARAPLNTAKIDVRPEELGRPIDIVVPSPPPPTPPPPSSSSRLPQQHSVRSHPNSETFIAEAQASTVTKTTPQWQVITADPFYTPSHVRLLYALSTDAVVCTINFSADGSKFVFTNTRTAFVIDSENGNILSKIDMRYDPSVNEFNPRCLRFTPDGKQIVLGNDDNNAVIFDVQTGRHIATLKQHTKKISSMLFTQKGKTLITSGYDRMICLWDMENYTLKKKIEHTSKEISGDDMIVSIASDIDQSFIAIGFMNGSVGVYDPEFEQPMLLFKAHDQSLMNIAISPFDNAIATGSADRTAKILGLHGRLTLRTTLNEHKSLVLALAFKPNGPILFTGSKDESIRAWDYKKSQLLFTLDAHKNTVFEISHHPTLNRFVSCSGEGLVCMWEYDCP